jgi:hypothetical protein
MAGSCADQLMSGAVFSGNGLDFRRSHGHGEKGHPGVSER